MTAIIHRIGELQRSGVLGQLMRFGIAGVVSTLIYAAVYMPLVTWVFPNLAVAAVPFAFAVAVTCGFFMHSLWSFKGHGSRDNSGRQHVKFLVVQGFGLLLNALFTWVIADLLHYPDWAPLIPIVTITPLATFALNRQWVFG
ncbi:GtrA family protein [Sphingomonas sp. BT-65]|uniref:GtrA family protein n=1 Tax=Sphingomonas sp. BT-65 TaxID=2989821 RepID=UPI0022369215|nr:GtrA family protein [Sphingomonas sp. BT-65]MCW4461565.1 GtrA family protein [Sphingomonas sp. BT-65]